MNDENFARLTSASSVESSDVRNLSLKLIDPPQHNAREGFDETSLRSLSESINTVGLLEPIIVRQKGNALSWSRENAASAR